MNGCEIRYVNAVALMECEGTDLVLCLRLHEMFPLDVQCKLSVSKTYLSYVIPLRRQAFVMK